MNEQSIKSIIKEVYPSTIVAATKYVDTTTMRKLYEAGIVNFGENKVDSFLEKYTNLKDLKVKWHFIGHLQSNKAKDVINLIDCLHSLDSFKLAKIIDEKREKPLDTFIEIKLVNNDAKSGIKKEEISSFIEGIKAYKKVNIIGFMVMTDGDMTDVEKSRVFREAKSLAKEYGFANLSMGMSDDYKLAIDEGATYVRLGRILYEPSDFKDEYKYYIKTEDRK